MPLFPADASSRRSAPPRRSDRFCRSRTRAAGPTLRHASIGASGQAFSDVIAFAKHPGLRSGRRRRRRSLPHRAAAAAVPEGPRLPGLARAAEEGAEEHRLGERLDARSHALHRRARGDEARQARLRPEAAVQHAAGDAAAHRGGAAARADDADGHPGLVEPLAALRRSARPQRHRRQDSRGAHVLEQELGRRQAAAGRGRSGAARRSTGTTGSASARRAPVQAQRRITRASGGGASGSAPARSATWAATSTARRIAR